MKKANTINADKYFHCKANYEAAQRGWMGWAGAKIMGDLRETLFAPKEIIANGLQNAIKDSTEDQQVNRYGRDASTSGKFSSAREACWIFRPEGLDERY